VVCKPSALTAIAKRSDAKLPPPIAGLFTDQEDAVQYAAAATVIRLSAVAAKKPVTKPASAAKGN
jgi:hypothetical protein